MSLGQCNPQSKLIWHIDRLNDFERTGTTKPILFEIDPSNKCNQDCPWCAFSKLRSESKELLDYDRAVELIYELKALGVNAINWTGGGEPLMHPRLVDLMVHADNAKLDQGIFTNGLLMNQKCGAFIGRRLKWIRISLDGYDEDSYAASHGTNKKCFSKVLDNIKSLVDSKPLSTVGIGFVINEHNYKGIEEVVLLSRSLGVDYVQLKPVAYRPYQEQVSTEFVEDAYRTSKEMEKYSTDNFNVMVTNYRFKDMMRPDRGREYDKCLSHHFQGAIGADGKVYICDHHKGEPKYALGDLYKSSLEEIWSSARRQQVIEYLNSTDLSQCQDCCRNHECNKFLWHMINKEDSFHPNHI